MKKLSEVNIKTLFPSHIYKRGLDYYKRNRVSNLVYDRNNQLWSATVRGTERYFTEIDMQGYHEGVIDTSCNCPAFDTYGTCKHIVATLLQIAHQEKDDPVSEKFNYQKTNHFINAITGMHQQEVTTRSTAQQMPLHIEYYCKWSYDQKLLIEMKAGVKRTFVVKDIEEFLDNVLSHREQFFTKNFTFSPESHYIIHEDRIIFDMLYSIIRNEEIYQGYTFYPQRKKANERRFIVIPPLLAESLLEHLIERNFTVETSQWTYHHPRIVKEQLPFQFSLTENMRNDLMLTIDNMNETIYFELYQFLFHEGVFYFPKREQLPILEQLNRLGLENQQLPIVKQQAGDFLSDVLPSLEKVGSVDVDHQVEARIIQVPLRAKLYLSMKDESLVGHLEYHYGDEQINPFHGEQTSDYIVSRDTEKESKIMALIEQANFYYNGKELYIPVDDETLYNFMYHIVPFLEQEVDLYLTSDIQNMVMTNQPSPQTNVEVESSSNLLEIGFNIAGVDDQEIGHILEAVIEKKRYYRLNSGAFLSLENNEYASIQQLFTDLDLDKDDIQESHVHMPAYRGTQVDELLETKKDYDASFEKLLSQLRSPEQQNYQLPEGLQATLRNYQVTGYQWFKSLSNYHFGGILADDMGLGKTLQSISYILSEPSDLPHLIVVPSSVVYNWKNEFSKFAPSLNVSIMTGPKEERTKKIKAAHNTDIWITSYATLRQDIDEYSELSFQTMILDEAQFIKNYATKTSKAIRQIQASRSFALSGTPIENSIDELWSILQVVLPGLLPNQRDFKKLSHEKIASLTKPFILRRLKQDVLTELPDKIESVYVSDLTQQQKELYVGYHQRLQQEANESIKESGFHQSRMQILAGLTRLRQLCCHPSLFIENYSGTSGKLEQLMETVKQTRENGSRMLIFSQFTSMHEIIRKRLEQDGISCFYLHGGTPSKDRVDMSEQFNKGEKDVFLISLKAGGTGLNLTGADTVILYDLWWNPAVEDQATGRAHRFGQKSVVQVIRMISEGTIEEKIYELQQKKRELIDQVIQPGETMLTSLSEKDIRELLNI